MRLRDPQGWAALQVPRAGTWTTLRTFAERWADRIEELVDEGVGCVHEVADRARLDVDSDEKLVTAVGAAVNLLRDHWDHGDELAAWYARLLLPSDVALFDAAGFRRPGVFQ